MGMGNILSTHDVIEIFSAWDPGQEFSDPSTGTFSIKDIHALIQRTGKKPAQLPLPLILEDFTTGESDEDFESEDFQQRAEQSDLNYPVIVIKYNEGHYAIADGRHRVFKRMLEYFNQRFVEIVQSLDVQVAYPKVKDVMQRVKAVQRQLFQYEGKYQQQTRELGKILLHEIPDAVTIPAYVVTESELRSLKRR